MPFEYDEARRPYGSLLAGVSIGELEILGLDALSELIDGFVARLYAGGGGPSSSGEVNVVEGLDALPPPEMVGRLSLLLARRLGKTLLRMPKPVKVSPLSGKRMGWWIALPVRKSVNSVSISFLRGEKAPSHIGMTSSGSGGGSGYPCSCEYWCNTVYRLPIRLFCSTIWFARRWGRMEKVAALRGGNELRRISSAFQ